jgi:hypothetical protein
MVVTPSPARKYFRTERVIVKFPGQAKPVQAKRLALLPITSMPSLPGGFQPFRLVINFKLVEAEPPGNDVLEFMPPIEVHVHYSISDIKKAEEIGKPLSLGFWDGKQWIRFTPEKHQFRLVTKKSAEAGGDCIVKLSHWGDPPIAVGT